MHIITDIKIYLLPLCASYRTRNKERKSNANDVYDALAQDHLACFFDLWLLCQFLVPQMKTTTFPCTFRIRQCNLMSLAIKI